MLWEFLFIFQPTHTHLTKRIIPMNTRTAANTPEAILANVANTSTLGSPLPINLALPSALATIHQNPQIPTAPMEHKNHPHHGRSDGLIGIKQSIV
jgi:hypothetical protein